MQENNKRKKSMYLKDRTDIEKLKLKHSAKVSKD
jgi:hypothetical protein